MRSAFEAVMTLTNLAGQKMTAVYVGLRFYDAKLNPVAAKFANATAAQGQVPGARCSHTETMTLPFAETFLAGALPC